jgi:WD40 repeat protein
MAVAALPDGTPVIISGGRDRTVRVWRLADGAPVGGPLIGHRVNAVAAGALPDGTAVIVSGGDNDGDDGDDYGDDDYGDDDYGDDDYGDDDYGDDDYGDGGGGGTVRVWRLADGAPVGEPLTGHAGAVEAVAVGALPDGTPVIVSGGGRWGNSYGTVRVWRLADGAPVGEPLTGHGDSVNAVAVGALPDGTPVIVSGGDDGIVQVRRLADGTALVHPLDLSEPVKGIALYGNIVVTAAGRDIAVHLPVVP